MQKHIISYDLSIGKKGEYATINTLIRKIHIGGIIMSSYQVKKTSGETAWFRHDRFGMFIHFGLYALPARHEWIKSYEKISEEKYQK